MLMYNMLINLLVPDVLMRKFFLQFIRNEVLLVIPLIPTDFFSFLW